jgi:FtsH-binding integral membrane protein
MLLARVLVLLAVMLVITAVTARINRDFETVWEYWITVILLFGTLIALLFLSEIFPLNIGLVCVFSAIMGWSIGPGIEGLKHRYLAKKRAKAEQMSAPTTTATGVATPDNPAAAMAPTVDTAGMSREAAEQGWTKIISNTLLATGIAMMVTAGLVFFTKNDFSFLGTYLAVALFALIILGIINIFVRSSWIQMAYSYAGVVIFTGYLLYDFDLLKKMVNSDSWSDAVIVTVNIYLDIVNLFLDLLYILAETSD